MKNKTLLHRRYTIPLFAAPEYGDGFLFTFYWFPSEIKARHKTCRYYTDTRIRVIDVRTLNPMTTYVYIIHELFFAVEKINRLFWSWKITCSKNRL